MRKKIVNKWKVKIRDEYLKFSEKAGIIKRKNVLLFAGMPGAAGNSDKHMASVYYRGDIWNKRKDREIHQEIAKIRKSGKRK